MLFWPIFGNFRCPVVTLVTFSSNISNFEKNFNPPPLKKNPFVFLILKKSKNSKKTFEIQKNQTKKNY